jgi:type II secretion system protein N
VEFRTASLRPWGLRLEDVVVRNPERRVLARLPWLRLRPSWLGLLGERPGFPWHVGAAVCAGTVEATVDDDGATKALDARWDDVDVATCLPWLTTQVELGGRATGTTALRLGPQGGIPLGTLDVTIRSMLWRPPLEDLEDVLVHADTATLTLAVEPERLVLQRLAVAGPDIDVDGSGTAKRAQALGDARLDLRMTVTPQPGLAPELRRYLAGLPRRPDGTYVFKVVGTIDAPFVAQP